MLNGTNILVPTLYIVRLIFYTAITLNSYSVIRKSKKLTIIHHPLSTIISSGIAVMLFGYLQYLLLPDTRFLYIMGWDDHYYRLISTHLDPAFTGIILVLTLINLQSLQLIKENLKLFLSILLTGAIVLTYSRSSYLALIIALFILVFLNIIKKTHNSGLKAQSSIFLLATSCLLLAFLPKSPGEGTNLNRTSTIEARQTNILENIPTDHKTLIFGQGLFVNNNETTEQLNNYPTNQLIPDHSQIPDNFFIFILRSTGIPGLLLMIIMLIQLGKFLYKKDQYLFASFIALLIHSQFNASITQPFVFLYFGMILANNVIEKNNKNFECEDLNVFVPLDQIQLNYGEENIRK